MKIKKKSLDLKNRNYRENIKKAETTYGHN